MFSKKKKNIFNNNLKIYVKNYYKIKFEFFGIIKFLLYF
jgi:hypothetical protein